MKILQCAIFCALLLRGYWAAPIKFVGIKDSRVSAGNVAHNDQFPFFAHILNTEDGVVCGATLITPWWIVSAAHCFTHTSSEIDAFELGNVVYEVYMASVLTFDENANLNEIKEVVVHPQYVIEFIDDNPGGNEKRLKNDIALARLKHGYDTSKRLFPVALPKRRDIEDESTDRCETGTIVGVGQTSPTSALSWNLQYAKIRTQNRTQLRVPKPKPCVNTIFYSESADILKEPRVLPGDSGGPFLCLAKTTGSPYRKYVLYGIIITGYNSTVHKTYVSVFESVEKHMDFISQHVEDAVFGQPRSRRSFQDLDGRSGISRVPSANRFIFLCLVLNWMLFQKSLNLLE